MTTTIQARRPGPKAWLKLIQAEARMTARDTAGLIVPLGMPLLILVMQAISFEDLDQEVAPDVTVLDYYLLPVVMTIVVTAIAVINMPSFLATYRKTKLLRRLAVTPASPTMVLAAQFVVSFLQVLLGIAVAFAVAMMFFDANLPQSLLPALRTRCRTWPATWTPMTCAPNWWYLWTPAPDCAAATRLNCGSTLAASTSSIRSQGRTSPATPKTERN